MISYIEKYVSQQIQHENN